MLPPFLTIAFAFFAIHTRKLYPLLLILMLSTAQAGSKNNVTSIQIASASNFRSTLELLAREFSQQHKKITLNISSGSTGALYEQIVHGAPYDIYFAADQKRPRLLIEKNLADKTTLFNYARGQLVMLVKTDFANAFNFSCGIKNPLIPTEQLANFLAQTDKIIIANPRIAPYGEAALDFLEALAKKKSFNVQWKYINAKNVLHAEQLFRHTRAPIAIISAAQLRALHTNNPLNNNLACVISSLAHQAIVQSAVIISRHADRPGAALKHAAIQQFWQYMHSKQASDIIQQHGYIIANNTTANRI